MRGHALVPVLFPAEQHRGRVAPERIEAIRGTPRWAAWAQPEELIAALICLAGFRTVALIGGDSGAQHVLRPRRADQCLDLAVGW
jgi:hypothetical protein